MPSLRAYLDRVADGFLPAASRALAPVLGAVRRAIEDADGYDEADAALARLEGGARADGLEETLSRAMGIGTSAGAADDGRG